MFRTNFAMMQHHNYSLTEIENMLPWERDIYVALLQQWVEEQNDQMQKQQAAARRR